MAAFACAEPLSPTWLTDKLSVVELVWSEESRHKYNLTLSIECLPTDLPQMISSHEPCSSHDVFLLSSVFISREHFFFFFCFCEYMLQIRHLHKHSHSFFLSLLSPSFSFTLFPHYPFFSSENYVNKKLSLNMFTCLYVYIYVCNHKHLIPFHVSQKYIR